MERIPPYYIVLVNLIVLQTKMPEGGNWYCPAGASQNCVHTPALLYALVKVTATACTSVRCAWTKPPESCKSVATFSRNLEFGSASKNDYFPYNGPTPLTGKLWKNLVDGDSKPAFVDFVDIDKKTVLRPSMLLLPPWMILGLLKIH